MKKVVVLAFFALGSIYFIACNRDNITPDSMSIDAVSAATVADSTKHKGHHGDSLHIHSDSLHTHSDSLHKSKHDSLGVKLSKTDSLGNKSKKNPKKKG